MHNNRPDTFSDLPMMAVPAPREKLEGGRRFQLSTTFQPAGDQPTAIAELAGGVRAGDYGPGA